MISVANNMSASISSLIVNMPVLNVVMLRCGPAIVSLSCYYT